MSKKMRGNLILLLTALIWGTAFVAQSAGMDHVQPFTYNGVRTLIGGLVLIPVIFLFDRLKPADQRPSPDEQKEIRRNSLIGGAACGVVLCVASSFQQFFGNLLPVQSSKLLAKSHIMQILPQVFSGDKAKIFRQLFSALF